MGSGWIMGFVNDVCFSFVDCLLVLFSDGFELECKVEGDIIILIYKIIFELCVGNVFYFKVYSGVVKVGDELENVMIEQIECFSQFFLVNGKD